MPSRAEVRRRLEHALRLLALLALGALAWRVLRPSEVTADARVARTSELADALPVWTAGAPGSVRLSLDSVPGTVARDWLRALAATGTGVRWEASRPLAPAAVSIETQSAPGGRSRLTILAPPGASVATHDGAGLVDSVVVGAAGVRTLDATLDGPVSVSSAGLAARTAVRDSVVLRPVLVLARAGWEGKFVVAALEEAGWRVEARFGVAPDVVVRQGAGPIDTSRYAAVVALDESARASAAAVTRYARDGGGVILTGAAAPVLSAIAPAQPSRRLDARLGGLLTAVPRVGLEATALGSVSREGVVVERRGQAPVIVAAREALGRVVVQGYAETWRWRMMGGEDAVAAHRQWWSGLVASVAYAPRLQLSSDAAHTVDAAPLASLVASLGPPAPAGRALAAATDGWWTPALFGLFLLALLAEWTSRRTRGVR